MKNLLVLMLLVAGCAVATKKPIESEPVYNETPGTVEVPNTQYHFNKTKTPFPERYAQAIPRVKKFFIMAVNDRTLLDGVKFTATTDTSDQIRGKIVEGFDVGLAKYTPTLLQGGKWSDVTAYHDDWVIYFNTYKILRDDCSIVNTIAHESMHALSYRHAGNNPAGNQMSVPYWVGNKAEELCKAGII